MRLPLQETRRVRVGGVVAPAVRGTVAVLAGIGLTPVVLFVLAVLVLGP